jgi:ergothioneine biosynthesis protein EgtB
MSSTHLVPEAAPRQLLTRVRASTRALCEPLELADFEAQSMPDASPLKWHLAHTTWFFEKFVLEVHEPDFEPWHPAFSYLFNSYYDAVGPRQPRPQRGLLSRPSLDQVWAYREAIERRVLQLLERQCVHAYAAIEVGCHHEQQHQELMLTDLKHLFAHNPLGPRYVPSGGADELATGAPAWLEFEGGLSELGASTESFSFDNERPRHRMFLEPFGLADRLVTNGEFEAFIRDRGYQRTELWLDQGFAHACSQGWTRPLYWRGAPGEFREFTLGGERELVADQPVVHLSYYEADAFARWAGARLPREAEWELACRREDRAGNFVESGRFHPVAAPSRRGGLRQVFGDVWEWTQSAYSAYPGYVPAAGALGEYNGKFMCGQMVLRGGSCATPESHIRATYRNFFPPPARWQFSGIRLARDLAPVR